MFLGFLFFFIFFCFLSCFCSLHRRSCWPASSRSLWSEPPLPQVRSQHPLSWHLLEQKQMLFSYKWNKTSLYLKMQLKRVQIRREGFFFNAENLTVVFEGENCLSDVDAVRDEAFVLHLHLHHEQVQSVESEMDSMKKIIESSTSKL